MPSVDELLNMAEVAEVTLTETNDKIEIDADTRTMIIPDTERIFGVMSDEKGERKYFRCKRFVGNGIDLSELSLRIVFQNASGFETGRDKYIVTDLATDGEDYVTFSWELSRKVTAYKGIISFIVCAIKTNSDGTITNEWNTTLANGIVLEGLEANGTQEQEEVAKDYYNQLEAELLRVANEQKTEIEKKAQEVIGTIPSDYTQTLKDVSNLKEELTDGRTDVDGEEHKNIGDAMRGQARKLRENLVVRQKEQPTDPNNNVWISDEDDEVEVPDMGEFNSLKEDLSNQEDKLEPIVKSKQDLKDAFYIVDVYGNIICKVDKDGVHASGFDGKNLALNDVISTYEDSFYISDSNGNVIFKADKDGVRGLNMGISSGVDSPFKGMKLLTIGDSLSAHNNWQKWLVEWLGVTFDNDENINGKDGHKPMAKGGTAIAPTTEDSIYMRSLDAKYYADDTNGTVIIIYAGQNDSVTLGTIDDTPYTDKTVTSPSNLTFYSSYMGMVENLLADIPSARIYLMTQMPVRLEIGMKGTVSPYEGVVRFPDMASVLAYEAIRYKKVEAIRDISEKYSLSCIDLWADSGINDYNSKYWYGAVGGTCGQVHPNNIGYKRMAEVAVAKMY